MAVILLANHYPGHADTVEMNLMSEGHQVVRVEDGRAALDYLKASTPDLIILEVDLPLMNGFEICSRVKSVKRLRKAPVLMWEEQVKGVIDGVGVVKPDAVLSKVAPWKEFRETVRLLLGGKKTAGKLRLH